MESHSQNVGASDPNIIDCEEIDGALPSQTDCQTQDSEKIKRRLTSSVWDDFTKIGKDNDGKERASCNYCGKKYVIGSKNIGTSTLIRHLAQCPKKPTYGDVGEMLIDHEGNVRAKKLDLNIVREMISMCLVEHDLPFSFVEYRRIRELHKYLNPDYKFISRNTAVANVCKFYERGKENLNLSLATIPSRICLTSDLWTACTIEGYICLTAHFVDENWRLSSKILSFCPMRPPHSGIELAKMVYNCLKDWGIEKKYFPTNNDNMQEILKETLCMQNNFLCGGEFFHVRCCAHILNLIVQEGLKVATTALHKIRESVKYVKWSEGRMKTFEECAQQGHFEGEISLRLDVTTQWNSTFTMLESAIRYRLAFSNLQLIDRNYKYTKSGYQQKKCVKF